MNSDLTKQQFELESCGRRLVISPNGGRITHFFHEGRNVLLDSGIQTGSTFWPSPQSLWKWPPPASIDEAPYDLIEHSDQRLSLRSPCDEVLGVQVTKSVAPIQHGFTVTYMITNISDCIVTMAPWEISRVRGGVTFYRSDSKPEAHSTCEAISDAGCYWFDYKVDELRGIPKVFANNTAGWLAYAEAGLLLLKNFPRIAQEEVAPMEGEVEIYGHADVLNPYVEIEQQGPFKAIMPGMRLIWAVDWRLFTLPDSIRVEVGSKSLTDFVDQAVVRASGALV